MLTITENRSNFIGGKIKIGRLTCVRYNREFVITEFFIYRVYCIFHIVGVMSQEVVHVPLYLSQLRLALITGIKGQSKEKWNGYQQELDRAASYIEFDEEFGNPSKSSMSVSVLW